MSSTLRLEIVTPFTTAYSGDAELVSLPTADGRIAVLPHHMRLLTQIVPGDVYVRKGGNTQALVIGAGLAEVTATKISIVTDMALAAEKLDEAAIEEARQRALDRIREKLADEEVASVSAVVARTLAQLRVKRRHRT